MVYMLKCQEESYDKVLVKQVIVCSDQLMT